MRTVEQELKVLEHRIDELVQLCSQLRDENRALRNKQSSLLMERAKLVEKNDLARTRVEGMLTRLKSLEQSV
jgi:cell division protein ZapB